MDWNTAKWNVTNMEEFDIDLQLLCHHQSSSKELLLLPGSWSAINAQTICWQLYGNINVVKTAEDLAQISAMTNRTEYACPAKVGMYVLCNDS